jgi:hypothetical protein
LLRCRHELQDAVARVTVAPEDRPDPSNLLDAVDAASPPPGHELLGGIDDAVVVRTGYEFFRSLVRRLAEATDVRYAFVARFDGDDYETMRIVTFHDRGTGEFRDDYPFPVAGTPCVHVLEGRVIAIPRGVCESFPAERRRGVQSYLAIPLVEPGGRVAGHLVAADTRDHDWSPADERTLRLFARRATTEILRHQYERALRDARAAAERASRARGEILDWLTHELRTPVHGILGHVELLGRCALDADVAAGVEAIRRSGERLRSLVGESLALARIGTGQSPVESRTFDVAELLEHVHRALELRARTSASTLSWTEHVPVPCIATGDDRRLRQLLRGTIARFLEADPAGVVRVDVQGDLAGGTCALAVVVESAARPALETMRLLASLLGAEFEVAEGPAGTRVRVSLLLPLVPGSRRHPASRDSESGKGAATHAVGPSAVQIPAPLHGALLDAARSGDVGALDALLDRLDAAGATAIAAELRAIAQSFDMAALVERITRIEAR